MVRTITIMTETESFQVLVFSKTAGYRHACIPAGHAAFADLATNSNGLFSVVSTEDAAAYFTPESLARFATVIFFQNSLEVLTTAQMDALKGFITNGGGYVGVHCASGAMYSDPWYEKLVGAWFDSHPDPQNGLLKVENKDHYLAVPWVPESGGSSDALPWFDEWYNYKSNPLDPQSNSNKDLDPLTILLSVDHTSFEGGTMGPGHPIAWCREIGAARSFYTALGHFDEAYKDKRFMEQLRRAILWTAKRED
ncbi:hypothetical protein jhhlp_002847 [Lomentospora prolificans]|uniref:ThuA-like domain-containing protein n=1 Tax=Lomentospora prolificans TaxID=41688 RepID=A0A2N3NF27_9PEZI|nr:hypothetical protein jhhlp_002847 [Lomentospora prolificans]